MLFKQITFHVILGGEMNKIKLWGTFFVYVFTFCEKSLRERDREREREREHNLRQIERKTQLNLGESQKYQLN